MMTQSRYIHSRQLYKNRSYEMSCEWMIDVWMCHSIAIVYAMDVLRTKIKRWKCCFGYDSVVRSSNKISFSRWHFRDSIHLAFCLSFMIVGSSKATKLKVKLSACIPQITYLFYENFMYSNMYRKANCHWFSILHLS